MASASVDEEYRLILWDRGKGEIEMESAVWSKNGNERKRRRGGSRKRRTTHATTLLLFLPALTHHRRNKRAWCSCRKCVERGDEVRLEGRVEGGVASTSWARGRGRTKGKELESGKEE